MQYDKTQHEIWKPITSYEGYYSVSSIGRVRRERGFYCKKQRLVKGVLFKSGYYFVRLSLFNKIKICSIQRTELKEMNDQRF